MARGGTRQEGVWKVDVVPRTKVLVPEVRVGLLFVFVVLLPF